MFVLIFSILLTTGSEINVMVGHGFKTRAECQQAWERTELRGREWQTATGQCIRLRSS